MLPIRDARVSKTLCISVFSCITLSALVTWGSATAPRQDAKLRPNQARSLCSFDISAVQFLAPVFPKRSLIMYLIFGGFRGFR